MLRDRAERLALRAGRAYDRSMPLVADTPFQVLAAALDAAASEAGALAMRWFRAGEKTSARTDYKNGGSPVTEADLAVDAFLRERLTSLFPDAGWLSEETADSDARLSADSVFIVDPIDGTRAFLSGDPRWTVSIAWVVNQRPVAGVVHAPALGETYAAALGAGATLNGAPIRASDRRGLEGARTGGPKPLIAGVGAAAGAQLNAEPRIPSLAYRLVKVASGELDVALAGENAHDWDIAGADIVLSQAGAALWDATGRALRYNLASARRPALAAAPLALLPDLAAALAASLH